MHELELVELHKNFQDKAAVQNVNMCLQNGVYGLL